VGRGSGGRRVTARGKGGRDEMIVYGGGKKREDMWVAWVIPVEITERGTGVL